MRAFGFAPEDFEYELEVLPENWLALDVFASMHTQWRTGFAGPTGLDYGALESVMRLRGVKSEDQPAMFEDIRLMEIEALSVMRAE